MNSEELEKILDSRKDMNVWDEVRQNLWDGLRVHSSIKGHGPVGSFNCCAVIAIQNTETYWRKRLAEESSQVTP